MNSLITLKKILLGGMVAMALVLTGCEADGDGTVGPGSGIGGGGASDGSGTCAVPVGEICVAGGDGTTTALLDELLKGDGPLAALAGPLADAGVTEALQDAVVNLLQNDGDLANLIQNLLQGSNGKDPNLQLALAALIDGGDLQDILSGLLSQDTLNGVLGEDGVAGVLQALLQGSSDSKCQANLATICLLGGDGGKAGLLDAVITNDGALADLAENLALDDLSGTLADLLENDDGSLKTLVGNLFQEGHLVEGLQALLDPNQEGSVADTLGDLLLGQGRDSNLVEQLLNGLGNLVGHVGG